jgi:hypothetical protein
MIKKLVRKWISAGPGFEDITKKFQNIIEPQQKSNVTIDQLILFLEEQKMDDYCEILKEIIEIYNHPFSYKTFEKEVDRLKYV